MGECLRFKRSSDPCSEGAGPLSELEYSSLRRMVGLFDKYMLCLKVLERGQCSGLTFLFCLCPFHIVA